MQTDSLCAVLSLVVFLIVFLVFIFNVILSLMTGFSAALLLCSEYAYMCVRAYVYSRARVCESCGVCCVVSSSSVDLGRQRARG